MPGESESSPPRIVHHASTQRETVTPEPITVEATGDQYSRRRFVQKGALALAGTFGTLPLMRLAKIDVALPASALPGSEDEYRRHLAAALGDGAAADDVLQEVLRAHGPERSGCSCTGYCDCSCDCGCTCRCMGQLCDCICQCACTCNCGCACNCDCSCNCTCTENNQASLSTTNLDSTRVSQRDSAISSAVTETSNSVIATGGQTSGQSQTQAGKDNNAFLSSRAQMESDVATTIVGTGQTSAVSTKAGQYIATTEANYMAKRNAPVPLAGPFGLAALTIGLLGAGWHALRKQGGAGVDPPAGEPA